MMCLIIMLQAPPLVIQLRQLITAGYGLKDCCTYKHRSMEHIASLSICKESSKELKDMDCLFLQHTSMATPCPLEWAEKAFFTDKRERAPVIRKRPCTLTWGCWYKQFSLWRRIRWWGHYSHIYKTIWRKITKEGTGREEMSEGEKQKQTRKERKKRARKEQQQQKKRRKEKSHRKHF